MVGGGRMVEGHLPPLPDRVGECRGLPRRLSVAVQCHRRSVLGQVLHVVSVVGRNH